MSKTLLLFDMDGTLTPSRLPITPEMKAYLQSVSKTTDLAVVSGSNLPKLIEQLGSDIMTYFKWVLPDNGVLCYKNGELISKKSMKEHIGQEKFNKLVNFALRAIADIDIPVKTGTFLELRSGNWNICPIGRDCTQSERIEFNKLDQELHIREKLIERIKGEFPDLDLTYAIGGQISFDVYPTGWDKTYAMNHVKDLYDRFVFFGDKTMPGGNDYDIAHCPLIHEVHQVDGPEHVMEIMKSLGYH